MASTRAAGTASVTYEVWNSGSLPAALRTDCSGWATYSVARTGGCAAEIAGYIEVTGEPGRVRPFRCMSAGYEPVAAARTLPEALVHIVTFCGAPPDGTVLLAAYPDGGYLYGLRAHVPESPGQARRRLSNYRVTPVPLPGSWPGDSSPATRTVNVLATAMARRPGFVGRAADGPIALCAACPGGLPSAYPYTLTLLAGLQAGPRMAQAAPGGGAR